ncbi:hypothetical protein ACOME3_007443 [Neoechinorhynchus agilis]
MTRKNARQPSKKAYKPADPYMFIWPKNKTTRKRITNSKESVPQDSEFNKYTMVYALRPVEMSCHFFVWKMSCYKENLEFHRSLNAHFKDPSNCTRISRSCIQENCIYVVKLSNVFYRFKPNYGVNLEDFFRARLIDFGKELILTKDNLLFRCPPWFSNSLGKAIRCSLNVDRLEIKVPRLVENLVAHLILRSVLKVRFLEVRVNLDICTVVDIWKVPEVTVGLDNFRQFDEAAFNESVGNLFIKYNNNINTFIKFIKPIEETSKIEYDLVPDELPLEWSTVSKHCEEAGQHSESVPTELSSVPLKQIDYLIDNQPQSTHSSINRQKENGNTSQSRYIVPKSIKRNSLDMSLNYHRSDEQQKEYLVDIQSQSTSLSIKRQNEISSASESIEIAADEIDEQMSKQTIDDNRTDEELIEKYPLNESSVSVNTVGSSSLKCNQCTRPYLMEPSSKDDQKILTSTPGVYNLIMPNDASKNLQLCDLGANIPDVEAFSSKSFIYVVTVESPREFYFWPMSHFQDNWEMINDISNHFSLQENRRTVFRRNLRPECVYVVKLANHFDRAVTVDTTERRDEILVYLVDFGRQVYVYPDCIFFCPRRFQGRQYMAYPCALESCSLPDFNEDDRCLNSILQGHVFEARLLYVDIHSWIHIVVKLWKVKSDEHVYGQLNDEQPDQRQRIPIGQVFDSFLNRQRQRGVNRQNYNWRSNNRTYF